MPPVWDTLGKDPLFAPTVSDLTVAEKKKLTFERVKRLHEYDFLPDEDFLSCPMKAHAFQVALLSMDSSLLPAYTLNTNVSLFACLFVYYYPAMYSSAAWIFVHQFWGISSLSLRNGFDSRRSYIYLVVSNTCRHAVDYM